MSAKSYRLDGLFSLKSPLSHIGEVVSNSSYLVQESVIQTDGSVAEVFVYNGNAWRGQLRDLMARNLLDRLGGEEGPARVGLDTFSLLFSGGRIGGAHTTDIGQARRLRAALPSIALLGGGVGNHILAGKMRVGNCYPLCREASRILPSALRDQASIVEYSDCTQIKEHSRRDDRRIETVNGYLAPVALVETPKKGKKGDDGQTDQMRIRMELLSPGVRLHTWISLEAACEAELGCLVGALKLFAEAPHIGGQGARGYGLADLDYTLTERATGEVVEHFVTVADATCMLSPTAAAALEAYDRHVESLKTTAIGRGDGVLALLEGAA